MYKGEYIGGYIADIVVANSIILELKSVQSLSAVMDAQLIPCYLLIYQLPLSFFPGDHILL
jgi:GxxExxY protein